MSLLITNILSEILSNSLQKNIQIISSNSVSGGDINNAYRLVANHGDFFIKTNSASRYPNMFEQEANGLNLLRNANTIKIPEVIVFGEQNDTYF